MSNKNISQKRKLEHWEVVTLLLMLYDFLAIGLSYFAALWVRFDCRYNSIQKDDPDEVTEQIANGSKENWVNISQITVNSNVDINQEGVYTVIYSYTSTNGYQGDTRLTVVVE